MRTFENFQNFNSMVYMCLDGVTVRRSLVRPKKSSIECETRSLVSFMGDSWIPGHWVLRSFVPICPIKDSEWINLLRPRPSWVQNLDSCLGQRVSSYTVRSSLFIKIRFFGWSSFRFTCLRLEESWSLGKKVLGWLCSSLVSCESKINSSEWINRPLVPHWSLMGES